mgnify:CR=1 FL=1|tara:strand:- start:190 stop:570 length:381 start_codon:yes stop_codon:yes gene_type:complete
MKPYSDLTAEELAMEKLFVRWVQSPDDTSIATFWEGWLEKNPTMSEKVSTARFLVKQASDFRPEILSNNEVNSLWGRIRNSLETITDREQKPKDDEIWKAGLDWKTVLLGILILAIFVICGRLLLL